MHSFFQFIETYSPLLPLMVLLIKWPYLKPRWVVILLIYLIIYVPLSAYANFLNTIRRNNSIIYLYINLLSFTSFSLMIEDFIGTRTFRRVNKFAIVLLFVFSIFNLKWFQADEYFNSNSFALAGLILIFYSLYYYKIQLEQIQILYVERQSSFWIVSGIFLYCSGNFFLFSLYSILIDQYENMAIYIWNINDAIILVMNIFFAKAIQCNSFK